MAKIGNDRMIVRGEQRADNSWLFTICYTAHFAEADLGQQFDDSVQISEIHRAGHRASICEHPVSFRATGHTVFRKKRIVVRGDEYDPEVGLDTVCASIRLHRHVDIDNTGDFVLDNEANDEQRTPALAPTVSGRALSSVCRRAPERSLRC